MKNLLKLNQISINLDNVFLISEAYIPEMNLIILSCITSSGRSFTIDSEIETFIEKFISSQTFITAKGENEVLAFKHLGGGEHEQMEVPSGIPTNVWINTKYIELIQFTKELEETEIEGVGGYISILLNRILELHILPSELAKLDKPQRAVKKEVIDRAKMRKIIFECFTDVTASNLFNFSCQYDWYPDQILRHFFESRLVNLASAKYWNASEEKDWFWAKVFDIFKTFRHNDDYARFLKDYINLIPKK